MAEVEEGNGVAEETMVNYQFVVRCRGLPWSAQREDMIRFFHDCQVQEIFFGKDHTGRASGEAFVVMSSDEDVKKAESHNNEHMTKRYIEVYKSSAEELDWFRRRNSRAQLPRDGVVHVRGLPFGCVESDLEDFFREFSLGPNGMVLIVDSQGRTTGDAYVQFNSPNEAGNAIQKRHMKKMGHRYLELFPSSMEYAQRALVQQEEKNLYGYSDSFGGRRGRGGPLRTHQSGGRTAPYARPGMHAGEGMGSGYEYQGRYQQQSPMGGGYNNMSTMGFGRGNGGGFGRGGGFGAQTGGFGDYGGNAGVGFGNNNVGSGGSGFGGYNRNPQMGFGRQQPQQGYSDGNSNLGGGGDAFQAAVMAAAAGVMSRQGIGNNPGQGSVVVHMRGLPYSATVQDIYEFFGTPNPVQVDIHYKDNGQATGEADAIFSTHEHAMTAMGKNGQHMGARYIELFLK